MKRFLATVRHLSLRQIATRAAFMAERAWWRVSAPRPRPWTPPDAASPFLTAPEGSRLREFQVQSFDYARALDADTFRESAKSWIAAHPRPGTDAWHPYPTSLRIANWCDVLQRIGDDPEIRGSIRAQARFLFKHLEHDVRGNHLLENARALIRAGALLDDAVLRARGVRVLRTEVAEQILADGGHFERTPGYHVRVLELLTNVANYVDERWLTDAVARMQTFLDAITPPDGRLPLLKDTVEIADRRSQITRAAAIWLPASGFAVVRDDAHGDFLIADFGRVCPDYLPAHAHADMFSFELTVGGAPVIVDSGVFEYAAGEWRTGFRSTAAHNTVEVDGRDQSEMWGSFRVGRRAHPRNVIWTDDASFAAISGEHDGYAPVIHQRTIVALKDARIWLIVDRIAGEPHHVARSFIHVHPDAALPHLASFGATLREEQGWYSERFGEKRRNRVLVLETQTPAWFGYVVSADADVSVALREEAGGCVLDVDSDVWHGSALVQARAAAPPLVRRIG
jgi:uncharacterized heparinase superfamily protein